MMCLLTWKKAFREGRARRLLFTMAVLVCAGNGIHSSCKVEEDADYGSVSCMFTEDVSQTKHDFLVKRYPPDGSREEFELPEDVLTCIWLDQEKPDCIVKDSYSFDYNISTTVVLHIPRVSRQHEGRYECQVVPAEPKQIEPCSFRLPVTNTPSQQDTTVHGSVVSSSSDKANKEERVTVHGQDVHGVIWIMAAVVAVLVAVVVICLLFLFYTRYANKHKDRGETRSPWDWAKGVLQDCFRHKCRPYTPTANNDDVETSPTSTD